jgi:hypothetical protein
LVQFALLKAVNNQPIREARNVLLALGQEASSRSNLPQLAETSWYEFELRDVNSSLKFRGISTSV